MDEPRDPGLATVLRVFGEALLEGVFVGLPGKITAYDPGTQKASVLPQVKHAHIDEFGKRIAKSLGEIHSVPVMFIGPARGRITTPVAIGDTAWIMFASSSIDRWVFRGEEVDPEDDRHHDINDAIAIVGLHDFAHVPTTAPTDAVVIHAGNGIKVKIGGPTGTEPTFMANTFLDAFGDLIDAIATATGTGAGAVNTAKTAFDLRVAEFTTAKTEVK